MQGEECEDEYIQGEGEDEEYELLEEDIDENYEPNEQEIIEYGQFLGMQLPEDEKYLYIAQEGLMAHLPAEWKPCRNSQGEILYINVQTSLLSYDHPCDNHYRELFQKAKSNKLSDEQQQDPNHQNDDDEQSLLLEEEFEENYEPADEEIYSYAEYLGMQLPDDEEFLYIAKEGLKAKLPEQWQPYQNRLGEISYINKETQERSEEHPCDIHNRTRFQKEKQKKEQIMQLQIIDEEEILNYDPTDQEIIKQATNLGMKFPQDNEFLHIAKAGLCSPLPAGWSFGMTKDHQLVYIDMSINQAYTDHPLDQYFQQMFKQAKDQKIKQNFIQNTSNESMLLDEEVDEHYVPNQEEIDNYSEILGIDLPEDEDLLYIVTQRLQSKLPLEWKLYKNRKGELSYINMLTNEQTFTHPNDHTYRELVRIEKAKKQGQVLQVEQHNNPIQRHLKKHQSTTDTRIEDLIQIDLDVDLYPVKEDIDNYAKYLGMELPEDLEYLYIAKEGFTAALPTFWSAWKNKQGEIYFLYQVNNSFYLQHPRDFEFRTQYLEAKQKKEKQVEKQRRYNAIKQIRNNALQGSYSVILTELEEYPEPTEEELVQCAIGIGMDLPQDEEFLYIAREALVSPLPKDWRYYQNRNGQLSFQNLITKQVSVIKPIDTYYEEMFTEEKMLRMEFSQELYIEEYIQEQGVEPKKYLTSKEVDLMTLVEIDKEQILEEEIIGYARYLGMTLPDDQEQLYIAEEGLKTSLLPENWVHCQNEAGIVYAVNFKTREYKDFHPADQKFKEQFQKVKQQCLRESMKKSQRQGMQDGANLLQQKIPLQTQLSKNTEYYYNQGFESEEDELDQQLDAAFNKYQQVNLQDYNQKVQEQKGNFRDRLNATISKQRQMDQDEQDNQKEDQQQKYEDLQDSLQFEKIEQQFQVEQLQNNPLIKAQSATQQTIEEEIDEDYSLVFEDEPQSEIQEEIPLSRQVSEQVNIQPVELVQSQLIYEDCEQLSDQKFGHQSQVSTLSSVLKMSSWPIQGSRINPRYQYEIDSSNVRLKSLQFSLAYLNQVFRERKKSTQTLDQNASKYLEMFQKMDRFWA